MPKEIRFGDLVKAAGKPQMITLWTNPKEDRNFMKAVKENRVLTLIQAPASKRKDFGRIGFHQGPYASYLVFPKPLPKANPRVIGIKYDLVKQGIVSDPVKLSPERAGGNRKKKAAPRRKTFHVLFRRWATIETSICIDSAATITEARRLATRAVAAEPFDLTKAVMKNEVLNIVEQ